MRVMKHIYLKQNLRARYDYHDIQPGPASIRIPINGGESYKLGKPCFLFYMVTRKPITFPGKLPDTVPHWPRLFVCPSLYSVRDMTKICIFLS